MNSTYTECLWSIAFGVLLDVVEHGGRYPYLVALRLQVLPPEAREDERAGDWAVSSPTRAGRVKATGGDGSKEEACRNCEPGGSSP